MAGRRTVKFVLIVVAALTLGGAAPPEADRQGDAPTALGRAVAHWQMGYTFHLLGQYTAAVRFFRKSIEIHPTARGTPSATPACYRADIAREYRCSFVLNPHLFPQLDREWAGCCKHS